jgi:CBS domain-containing protein
MLNKGGGMSKEAAMVEREAHRTASEATLDAGARGAFRSDRYHTALERYLAAVARPALPADSGHGERYWNLEGNLVRDVMTTPVISVGESATFKEIVATLADNRVSAIPVVNAARAVVGVVSESDLLAKVVTGGDPRARHRGGDAARNQVHRKSHGETAGELMASPVITTHPEASVVDAARAAALGHVRRLPVVDGSGVLVGIVTRSDLLRVFLRDDDELRAHIRDVTIRQLLLDPASIEVSVTDGVVTLAGQLDRRMQIGPLLEAVRSTAGVVGVHDNLSCRADDTALPPPPARAIERTQQ